MHIVSVNVGRPRLARWRGRSVSTGIFKAPVEGRVMVRATNLEGDRQADLSVHGGPLKAVYAYPSEHYEFWRGELPDLELPWGKFGENLTTVGLDEGTVHIGDRFRIGSAELVVTQPRIPCFKLALRFGREDMPRRFLASGRSGIYLSVAVEGELGAGDPIEWVRRDPAGATVADIARLQARDKHDLPTLRRAVQAEALPEAWRDEFRSRIARLEGREADGPG